MANNSDTVRSDQVDVQCDNAFAADSAAGERLARWGRCSVILRWRWRQIASLLGPTTGQVCLEIGAGSLGTLLRRNGGEWHSADRGNAAVARLHRLYGTCAAAIEADGHLPFPNGYFDAAVVTDTLERWPTETPLIAEIHRTLKPAGRLIIETPFLKKSLLHPLRRALGFSDERLGRVRVGYTESHLYEVLKDGFDVQEVRVYSGFFAELFEWLARWVAERRVQGPPAWTAEELDTREFGRLMRIYGILFPAAWVGAFLDRILPLRGHRIALRAKRRLWIPRKTPVLRDGRSIAEATLRARIGTASPLADLKRP